MMSARQFAEKYPGQEVRVSSFYFKEFDFKAPKTEVPLGIVVGFRIGQKGVSGSSKVAIWHDKHSWCDFIQASTGKSYNAVIPNAPEKQKGIYFLSVNHI